MSNQSSYPSPTVSDRALFMATDSAAHILATGLMHLRTPPPALTPSPPPNIDAPDYLRIDLDDDTFSIHGGTPGADTDGGRQTMTARFLDVTDPTDQATPITTTPAPITVT